MAKERKEECKKDDNFFEKLKFGRWGQLLHSPSDDATHSIKTADSQSLQTAIDVVVVDEERGYTFFC